MAGYRYVSKLGVLGSDFETFCEILKILMSGLGLDEKKNSGKNHLFLDLFSEI